MAYLHMIVAGPPELVLYAFSLFVGVLPDALLLLQRRRGLGGRSLRRRRRSGGIFGALGALVLVFLFGFVVILALIVYAVYKAIRGPR